MDRRGSYRAWVRAAARIGVIAVFLVAVLVGYDAAQVHGQTRPIPGAPITPFSPPVYPGGVKYTAGWHLISGLVAQTLVAQGSSNVLLTWQAGDNAYQTIAPGSDISVTGGYWVDLAAPVSLRLAAESLLAAQISIPAGQYVLVGNPSTTVAILHGADAVYAYDAASGSYQPRGALLPGEGAWVYSSHDAVLSVVSTAQSCEPPPAALPENDTPVPQAPTPVHIGPPSLSCYPPPSP